MKNFRIVVLGKSGKVEIIFNQYRDFRQALGVAVKLARAGVDVKRIDIEKRQGDRWVSYWEDVREVMR